MSISACPSSGTKASRYTRWESRSGARSATPGACSVLYVMTLIGTSVIFTGVSSGTYYLRFAAVNGAGTGPASNEISLVVP